jgi:hypothetical protein
VKTNKSFTRFQPGHPSEDFWPKIEHSGLELTKLLGLGALTQIQSEDLC